MAIYECIEAVEYGKRKYEVGSTMEINDKLVSVAKQDEIIRTHFQLQGDVVEEPDQATQAKKKVFAPSQTIESSPDMLNKMNRDEKIVKLQNDIKAIGGKYDKRWGPDKLQSTIKKIKKEAMK